MPQLDTVTYLTQYTWTLIILFLLFSLIVTINLGKIQQQLGIRAKFVYRSADVESTQSTNQGESVRVMGLDSRESMSQAGIEVFKTLWNLR